MPARLRTTCAGLGWTGTRAAKPAAPAAPIFKSQRQALYRECFARLKEKGLVYPCYCTRSELHDAQAPHREDGMPVYSGRCRTLSRQERETLAQTRKPAFRLMVPDREIVFQDGFQGNTGKTCAGTAGTSSSAAPTGFFAYQLAVVADDGEMNISQVVRGCDLLDLYVYLLYLYELLGYPAPEFYHIPLMMSGQTGKRLSKRDRDKDLGWLRKEFSRPEPILGQLGHMAGLLDRPEPVTARELYVYLFRELAQVFAKTPPEFLQKKELTQ